MSYHGRTPFVPHAHNRQQLEVWLETNLDIRNKGREEWNASCPFHQTADTSRPDLYVNVEKGVFHCLSSACEAKGTVQDLVRRLTGGSWEDARRAVGRPGREALGKLLLALRPQPVASLALSWDLIHASRSTAYWSKERQITLEAQEHFMLGFDFEKNHALIPYLDQQREPICFLRRQMVGHPRYLYPNEFDLENSIYHLYACDPTKPLVVVEGSVDAMRVWEAGIPNVVALLGSSFPPQKCKLLRHFRVISFLDADPAGVQGTWKLREGMGRLIMRANYPEHLLGKDPGSLSNIQIHECLNNLSPVY